MLYRNYTDEYTAAALPRSVDRSKKYWDLARPPTTLGEEIAYSAQQGLEKNLTYQIYDLWDRKQEVHSLQTMNPYFKEVLSPEQIAKEFPNTLMPIKSPKTRAEMKIISDRDFRKQTLIQVLEGKNTSMDSAVNMISGFAGGALDPLGLGMFFGAGSLIPIIPKAKNLLTMRQVARTAMQGRVAGAGIVAMDGIVGGLLYNTSQYMAHQKRYRPYGVGEIFTNTLIDAGVGGALGFFFPSLGGHIADAFVSKDGVPSLIVGLNHLKRVLNDPRYRGKFHEYMADEGGAFDFQGLLDLLSGNPGRTKRKSAEERLNKVEIEDMVFTGVTIDGDVVSRKVKDLKHEGRLYKEVPSTVDILTKKTFKKKGRFAGLKMTGEGVVGFGGITFRNPKKFYTSAISSIKTSQGYIGKAQPSYVSQFKEVYAAIPGTDGFNATAPDQRRLLLASTPQGAAHRYLREGGHLIEGLERIKIAGLKLKVGSDGVKLFNLNSFAFRNIWKTVINPGKPYRGNIFGDASDVERGKILMDFHKSDFLDGSTYKTSSGGIKYDSIDLRPGTYDRVEGISDTVVTFDLMNEGSMITRDDVNLLSKYEEGLAGYTNPPAVNQLYEAYIEDFVDEKGKNLFDTFIKRLTYPEKLNSSFRQHSLNIPLIITDIKAFNPQTPFSTLPKPIWKSVVAAYEKVKGSTIDEVKGWIENMDQVYVKLLGNSKEQIEKFTNELKMKHGFRFPAYVHANYPEKAWMVLKDRVIEPLGKGENVLDSILAGKTEAFDDVQIIIPYRDLELNISPRLMTREENNILTRIMKDGVNIEIGNFDNTTSIVTGVDKARKYIRENANTLAKLGVSRVIYRTAENNHTIQVHTGFQIDGVGIKGKEYRDSFERLKEVPELPEGVTPPARNEVREATISMLETMGSSSAEEYGTILRIGRDMTKNMVGSSGVGNKLKQWNTEYVKAGQRLKSLSPEDAGYTEALRDFRTVGRDIQKNYAILQMMKNGGLDFTKDSGRKILRFMDGFTTGFGFEADELMNILNFQPQRAYESFGGYNILAVQSSNERFLTVGLFSSLRKEGGDDLINTLAMGLLDEDLLKISYYMRETVTKQGGTKGTLAADARESMQVSDTAWQVYPILVQNMEKSQNMLSNAGYTRRPIHGFIGTRSYDTNRIIKTDKEVFIDHLVARAEIDRAKAEDFYYSVGEIKKIPSDLTGPISQMTRYLEANRTLRFKSAKDELEFLDMYGSVTRAGTARAGFGDLGTNSHIMAGILSSIQSDSRLAAVTSILGTRPFFTLVLADSLLKKKYTDILQGGGFNVDRAKLFGAIENSVGHFRKVLMSLILGEPQGMSNLAKTRRFLRATTNLSLLPRVGINSVFYDWVTSVAQLQKFRPGEYMFGVEHFFRRLGHMFDKKKIQEIAAGGNVLLLEDTRDYTRRMYGDNVAGIGAWFEGGLMDITGINRVTDGGRTANTIAMGMWMAEAVKLPWGKLTDQVQALLSTHQIDKELWEWFRVQGAKPVPFEGVDLLLIGEISEMLDLAVHNKKISSSYAHDLLVRFDTFFGETAQTKGVPMSDIYTRGFFDVNRDDPDGVLHNVGKLMTMYMPTGLAAFRSMSDAAYSKKTGKRYNTNVKKVGMLMARAFVAGAAVTWVGDMAKGRTPRDPDNIQFIWEAMVRGGAFGIMGDFLLGSHNDREAGFLGNFTGPAISGPVYDAASAIRQLLMLEPLKSWEHINKTFWHLFPNVHGLDLLVQTAFLDSLGDLGGSPEADAIKRRYLAEQGSRYFAD